MHFEVYPSVKRGKPGFRFRLVGNNSKIVASGEFYVSERNCLKAIARMKQDVPQAEVRGAK